MAKVFIFLEFNDEAIHALLSEIRRVLSGGENPSSHVHITIRGPFEEPREEKVIQGFLNKLDSEPILINGIGKFTFGEKAVVYLKVSSPHLEKIWYKPDYPIDEYGFNPHISLFEGSLSDAEKVYGFLLKEDLSLMSHEYEITQHSSKNMKLFEKEARLFSEKDFSKLILFGRVKAGILMRAQKILTSRDSVD